MPLIGFSVDNILSSSYSVEDNTEADTDNGKGVEDGVANVFLGNVFSSLPSPSPPPANKGFATSSPTKFSTPTTTIIGGRRFFPPKQQQQNASTDEEIDGEGKCCGGDDDKETRTTPTATITTTSLSNELVSQWAMQCIRMFTASGSSSNGQQLGQGEAAIVSQREETISNPLFLSPPLGLASGTGFPLFQHMQKTKRVRTAFSPTQLVKLELAFRHNQYLVGSDRKQLAKQLALSETQVKVWFQNRRTKSKRMDFLSSTTESGDRSTPSSVAEGERMRSCDG